MARAIVLLTLATFVATTLLASEAWAAKKKVDYQKVSIGMRKAGGDPQMRKAGGDPQLSRKPAVGVGKTR